jgi:hypothetical protein
MLDGLSTRSLFRFAIELFQAPLNSRLRSGMSLAASSMQRRRVNFEIDSQQEAFLACEALAHTLVERGS